jgi:hypothetical protein
MVVGRSRDKAEASRDEEGAETAMGDAVAFRGPPPGNCSTRAASDRDADARRARRRRVRIVRFRAALLA